MAFHDPTLFLPRQFVENPAESLSNRSEHRFPPPFRDEHDVILAIPSGMSQALIRLHREFSFRLTLIKPPRGELYSLIAQSSSSRTGETSGLPSKGSYDPRAAFRLMAAHRFFCAA